MSTKLKLVTPTNPGVGIPYIVDGPFLAYRSSGGTVVLNQGGSPRGRLVKCSDLKRILSKYLIKGTKFIINTYNPTLYSLIPGISSNDNLFNSDNDFIPTLPVQSLIRNEVDGFNSETTVTQSSVRSIKACDNWNNNLEELGVIEEAIDDRVKSVFGYYKDYPDIDLSKEVPNKDGGYSVDLSEESLVVSLISGTTYTDTINLEDWVLKSRKGLSSISGKLDISYMYSKGGKMYGGMQTIKAFQYEEDLTSNNIIIDLGDIQIEYMENVLKIYPVSEDVDEVVFNDCTLTIGVL